MRQAFGRLPEGYSSVFRFDPGEALVILGLLPPRGGISGFKHISLREKELSILMIPYTRALQP
jgi:hypothetical protein